MVSFRIIGLMAENHEYQVSDRLHLSSGIIISQFDQYDYNKRPEDYIIIQYE